MPYRIMRMSGLRGKTSVLAKRCLEDPQQFFVVSEGEVLCKIPSACRSLPRCADGCLLCIQYIHAVYSNFYSLLEYFLGEQTAFFCN